MPRLEGFVCTGSDLLAGNWIGGILSGPLRIQPGFPAQGMVGPLALLDVPCGRFLFQIDSFPLFGAQAMCRFPHGLVQKSLSGRESSNDKQFFPSLGKNSRTVRRHRDAGRFSESMPAGEILEHGIVNRQYTQLSAAFHIPLPDGMVFTD